MSAPRAPRRMLVVATRNEGKLAELRALLGAFGLEVRSAAEARGAPLDVEEDGATFEANARKKAHALATATGALTLADDSGLEVDALDGAPGVHSARFAGTHGDDQANNRALVAALASKEPAANGVFPARFRCVLVLVDPTGGVDPLVVEGSLEGGITRTPRGVHGFGYDPYFVVETEHGARGRTLAELTQDEKNRVSHRARAFRRLEPALRAWLTRPDLA